MEAVEACIPIGEAVAIVPSFRSRRERCDVEAVRLGAASVTGLNGHIRQRGIWLMQFSWYGGQTFLPPSYQIPPVAFATPSRTETVTGACVTTVPTFGKVYGHVLLDELPMLLWLMEDETRLSRFATVLCTPLALRLLDRMAHPLHEALMTRASPVDDETLYEAEELTALRRTGCRMNPSLKEMGLLRVRPSETLAPDTPRRLFINRAGGTRRIINEVDVAKVLERHGVRSIAPEELDDPWAAFAAAELICGVSGSNLSDSVFMSPGAGLLEIHPSDHIKPYNWNVAGKLGVTYRSMIAPSEQQRNTVIGPGNSPIHVPPEDLDTALTLLQQSLYSRQTPSVSVERGPERATDGQSGIQISKNHMEH